MNLAFLQPVSEALPTWKLGDFMPSVHRLRFGAQVTETINEGETLWEHGQKAPNDLKPKWPTNALQPSDASMTDYTGIGDRNTWCRSDGSWAHFTLSPQR